jgi:Bacterial PH domain
MRIGDAIYNLDGLPFRNEGMALRMRDLLSGETGKSYQLLPYLEGGFVLRLAVTENSYPASARPRTTPMPFGSEGIEAGTIQRQTQPSRPVVTTRGVDKVVELRQAVARTNITALLLMALSVCFVVMADSLLLGVLDLINLHPGKLGAWLNRLDQGMTGFGAFLLVTLWLSFLWQRAGALYRVTDFGVEARLGIIAHQTVGLRFQDIRSMSIKQSLLDRLLNVGLLEFTSAGTDGDPVRFDRIANPAKVLQIVKDRMARAGSSD